MYDQNFTADATKHLAKYRQLTGVKRYKFVIGTAFRSKFTSMYVRTTVLQFQILKILGE